MILKVKVRGKSAMIVGYAPGISGAPLAIVITEGKLIHVPLPMVELIQDDLPRKLRKRKTKSSECANIEKADTQ